MSTQDLLTKCVKARQEGRRGGKGQVGRERRGKEGGRKGGREACNIAKHNWVGAMTQTCGFEVSDRYSSQQRTAAVMRKVKYGNTCNPFLC